MVESLVLLLFSKVDFFVYSKYGRVSICFIVEKVRGGSRLSRLKTLTFRFARFYSYLSVRFFFFLF